MKILKKSQLTLIPLAIFVGYTSISCAQNKSVIQKLNSELSNVIMTLNLPNNLKKTDFLPSHIKKEHFSIQGNNSTEVNIYLQPNDSEGRIDIFVALVKNKSISRTKKMSFNGFKTQHKQPSIANLEQILQRITLKTNVDKTTIFPDLLKPSDISILLNDELLDSSYDANITIEGDRETGIATINLGLTKGIYTSNIKTFKTLTGFKQNPKIIPEPEININFEIGNKAIHDLISTTYVAQNNVAIKALLDNYTTLRAKKDAIYIKIINSPLLSFVYANELAKTTENDSIILTLINNIIETPQSINSSILNSILTSSLSALRTLATAINNVESKIPVENNSIRLKKMYIEIVDDILTNYYYGEKNGINNLKQQQSVYQTWYYYESTIGNSSMLSQISDLVIRGANFIPQVIKQKYKSALNYFIEDVSKRWSSDRGRYIVRYPYLPVTNDSIDEVLNAFRFKVFAANIDNDKTMLKTTLSQLRNWFIVTDITNNPWKSLSTPASDGKITINYSGLAKTLDLIWRSTDVIISIAGNSYKPQLQLMLNKLFDWTLNVLLTSKITINNITTASKSQLEVIGLLTSIAVKIEGSKATKIIEELSKIFNLQTNKTIANFNQVSPDSIKIELEKYLTKPSEPKEVTPLLPVEPKITINLAQGKNSLKQLLQIRNVSINNVATKKLYNKYLEIKNQTDPKYNAIKASPFLTYLFANEVNKPGSTDEKILIAITKILETDQSKTYSYFFASNQLLPRSLLGLQKIAAAINNGTVPTEDSPSIDNLKEMYLAIVNDILTNWYYGSKIKTDGSVKNQKIYRNWAEYENPNGNFSMLKQISDLIIYGENFLNADLKNKYKMALNYFISDVSKIWSSDRTRYITNAPIISRSNYSINFVLQYFRLKILVANFDNDTELFKTTLEQLRKWFTNVEIAKNPWEALSEPTTDGTITIDYNSLMNILNLLRLSTDTIIAITDTSFNNQLEEMFSKLFTWAIDELLTKKISPDNVVSTSNEQLRIIGILSLIAKSIKGKQSTALITKIQEALNGKTKTSLTNFESIPWHFIKIELEKYLLTS